jgi:hypothetical protein
MAAPEDNPSVSRLIIIILLSWLAMIGFDLILHAGFLARLYREPTSFLLPPERAFILIPIGYLSFLLLAILLVWLMAGLGILGWQRGAVFGLTLGAMVWGALVLGLLSISTAPPALMLGWFLGQSVEMGIGGTVAGSGLATRLFRQLFLRVVLFVIGALAITIVLQNLGGTALN